MQHGRVCLAFQSLRVPTLVSFKPLSALSKLTGITPTLILLPRGNCSIVSKTGCISAVPVGRPFLLLEGLGIGLLAPHLGYGILVPVFQTRP